MKIRDFENFLEVRIWSLFMLEAISLILKRVDHPREIEIDLIMDYSPLGFANIGKDAAYVNVGYIWWCDCVDNKSPPPKSKIIFFYVIPIKIYFYFPALFCEKLKLF